jgi:nucleotide-binding universal stress UspA family protein
MTEQVLVPYDGSPLAKQALERAVATPDADVTLLHVIAQFGVVEGGAAESESEPESAPWYDRAHGEAERLLEDAVEALDPDGRGRVATAIEVGPAAPEVLAYVDEHGVDHVVMGCHGKAGVSGEGLGSVADRLVREASVPVTVVR